MRFTQPTIHHVMYIESGDAGKRNPSFPLGKPKSMWLCIETEGERRRLDKSLAELRRMGFVSYYLVSACMHGDDSWPDEAMEELEGLEARAKSRTKPKAVAKE